MSRREEHGPFVELAFPTYPGFGADPPRAGHDAYYRYGWVFYWGFVRNIFNRPELPAAQYPRPAAMREQRRFEGELRVVPLVYLDGAVVPGDMTAKELREFNFDRPIEVQLPAVGVPFVPRRDIPTLVRARELLEIEIAVRVRYV